MCVLVTMVGGVTDCLPLSVTQMLLTPGTITMIIAATRMHRYLVDFAFGSPNGYNTLNFLSHFILLSLGIIILVRATLSRWAVSHTRDPSRRVPQ